MTRDEVMKLAMMAGLPFEEPGVTRAMEELAIRIHNAAIEAVLAKLDTSGIRQTDLETSVRDAQLRNIAKQIEPLILPESLDEGKK